MAESRKIDQHEFVTASKLTINTVRMLVRKVSCMFKGNTWAKSCADLVTHESEGSLGSREPKN